MRRQQMIILALLTIIFMMASAAVPGLFSKKKNRHTALKDSVAYDSTYVLDSLGHVIGRDTTKMDSLTLAIYHHNRAIDDSLHRDSLIRQSKHGIEAPVDYEGEDSMVYDAASKTANLYGDAKVKYQDMNLASECIYMSLDSSLVRANGIKDTSNNDIGTPVFTIGNDKYESKQMVYNFKTRKGLIGNVYTEQDDGFMRAETSKRDSSGIIYMKHGRYTTCDDPHPDFYIALSRAKVKPGKNVVFGPAYLVVEDVPLPLAIPYGFFPFSKEYSSGLIMPTYGDDYTKGFYLHDGGWYFALNDHMDLKLLGEIYTKGSWGLSAASNYRKRYRYSGSFLLSYLVNKDEDSPTVKSFKIQWHHTQDSKANPYRTLSASVNFATTKYERSNLNSLYNPQSLTQSTRTSSVSMSTQFSSIGLSLSSSANVNQNMRDSSIAMTLPDLSINLSRFYPFKRKHSVGKERWYEKIYMSYTGHITNSISTKEDKLLKSSLIKDWRNGWQHNIPIGGSFTLGYINISPSFNLTDRTYSSKILRTWDESTQKEVCDTTYGFYNVYNWSLNLSASTKVYGFYTPNRHIFGNKIVAVRHVLTPTVSFSYAPNFADDHYGFWKEYQKTDAEGNVTYVKYSPFSNNVFGTVGNSKTGSVAFSLDNNIEMKIRSDKDSTGFRKLSIIDNLGISMSYNMAAERHQWSDMNINLRLKWWKNYTFSTNLVFATYAYALDKDGNPYVGDRTMWSYGKFGRFQGISQNFSFTLNPEKLRKLFGHGDKEDDSKNKKGGKDADDNTDIESNVDTDLYNGQHAAKKSSGKAETDADGYMSFSMPWSLTIGYGIVVRENTGGTFNKEKMRYPYKITQTMNCSGNIRISDGWNISFSSGYDFEYHKVSMTTASLSRDLHCFNMSCSVVLAPYTSYNFSFRCNAATLTDALKYDKRSSYSNAIKWY